MHIYLPIAEMAVSAEMLLAAAMMVGFLSGIFGIGGGFVLTPLLIFMGIPAAIAVGTQSNQLMASSITGVLGHLRKGNVDIKLGLVMLGGSVFGSIIGVLLFSLLKYLGQIDIAISLSYVVMLGTIGSMMLFETLNSKFSFFVKKQPEGKRSWLHELNLRLPYKMRFHRSKIYISAFMPAGIGFIGGLMVAVMGVGGGFVMVPAMIYILRMSPLMVAGTSLFQIIFTSAFTSVMHAAANQTVDLVLAFILISGGVIGAQFGVRFARHVSGIYARLFLAIMILTVAFKLAADLVIEPSEIYSFAVRE